METQKQQTATEEKKPVAGGLFEGLSVPQVAAGALAAVTSLLLSSKIGWGGSAIGVAVGSVVSTVSSQVYKKFFQKSADKIKDVVSSGPNGTTAMPAVDEDPSGVADAVAGPSAVRDPYGAGATPHARAGATQQMGRPGTQTTVAHPVVNDDAILQATADSHRSATTGTRVVSDRLEHKAQQRQKARKRANVQKSVIVVSIVSAILAMLVSAGVVSCATSGEGLGSKPEPIVKTTSSSDSQSSASSSASQESASAASSDASSQSSSDSGEQTVKPGVVINESGNGSGTSGSGTSGSGTTGSGSGTAGTSGSGSGSGGSATTTSSDSGSGTSGSGSGGSSTSTSKDSGASTSAQSTASDSGDAGSGSGNSGSSTTK